MTTPPAERRMTRTDWLLALVLVLVGLAPRVVAYATYRYTHDETKIIQRNIRLLEDAVRTGDAWAFAVDVPLQCSTSITPLWGWIQWGATRVLSYDRLATRVPQIGFSLLGILLVYVLVVRVFGRTTAIGAASAFALSDLCIWTGVKSEFPEPLLLCCVLAGVIGMLSDRRRGFALGCACLGVAPMVHLGKGVFLYALFALWLSVTTIVGLVDAHRTAGHEVREARRAVFRRALGQAVLFALSLVPTLVWMFAALWRSADLRLGEATIATMWEVLPDYLAWVRVLTVDYFEYRPFMKGTWRTMLLVYTFLPVWPTAVLMAPWAAVGMVVGLRRLAHERDRRRRMLLLALPTLGLVPFAYSVINGFQAGRFTLLFHVPFAIACGLALTELTLQLTRRDEDARRSRAAIAWLLGVPLVYAAVAGSMTSWARWEFAGPALAGLVVAAFVLVAVGVVGARRASALAWLPLVVWVLLTATSLARFGPLYWGAFRGFAVEGRMAAEYEETLRSEFPRGDGFLFLRR
jgi:hypothetical protein